MVQLTEVTRCHEEMADKPSLLGHKRKHPGIHGRVHIRATQKPVARIINLVFCH
jgi:hypothetical protein